MSFPRPPHVVCFAPYTTWSIHSARQVAILHALRLRGCTVTYVTCDGVFSDCDVLQPANGAPATRPPNACLICQSSVAARMASWGMPYRWFGRWLTSADFREAAAWASGIRGADLAKAAWGDLPIAAWVASSVHKHVRHNTLDLTDPKLAHVFASYLYSGRLAATGLGRLLDEEKPDFLLLFNGRMGPMRIALELGRRRGIRALVEERGVVPGHLTLHENRQCIDSRGLLALWDAWKSVPLTRPEIAALRTLFEDRWRGQKDSIAFVTGARSAAETRKLLRLDPSRPVWALFTSNLDEMAGSGLADGVFATHDAWVLAALAFARTHPAIQLVIRVHPNSGGTRSFGSNAQELAFYADLAKTLPDNVRLVPSDDPLNSYGLAALSQVGLTWHSTIGLEMAALGKPVVRCGSPEISAQPTLVAPQDAAAFAPLLAKLASGAAPEPLAFARAAWRFAALSFHRYSFPFPLVKQTDWYMGDLAFDGIGALAPGRDAMLDRICAHVIEGVPLHGDPPSRVAADEAAEEAELARWIAAARSDPAVDSHAV